MKTASTYLQLCLTGARAELANQGICYPAELTEPKAEFMHMALYRALARHQAYSLREAVQRLNAAGHHTILLSCEHLVFIRPSAFQALRDLLGNAEIRIVYTSRRWSDRIPSIWNQTLVMGGAETLPDCLATQLAGHPMNYYTNAMKTDYPGSDLDHSITWRVIANIFGRDALLIFPYSVIMDEGANLFERFCRDILGLAAAPRSALTATRCWASLPPPDQEILRVLNARHIAETGQQTSNIRRAFLRHRRTLDTTAITAAMAPHAATVTIDDTAPAFQQAFDNMCAYGDRIAGATMLFERRRKQTAYIQPRYLLRDDAREDLRALYHRIKPETGTAQSAA